MSKRKTHIYDMIIKLIKDYHRIIIYSYINTSYLRTRIFFRSSALQLFNFFLRTAYVVDYCP